MKTIDIKDRVKAVRLENGLTQKMFAQRLGIAQTSYSSIETGASPVQERYIISICSEFHISEAWLRTGEGEMYDNPEEQLVQRLADQYGLEGVYLHVVRAFLTIPPEYRADILKLARALVLAGDESAAAQFAADAAELDALIAASRPSASPRGEVSPAGDGEVDALG